LGAIAPAGAGLPDRVAYLEGSVAAAWETLDGFFTRLRRTQAELVQAQERLTRLANAVHARTTTARKDA
jgi:hypothetical protein